MNNSKLRTVVFKKLNSNPHNLFVFNNLQKNKFYNFHQSLALNLINESGQCGCGCSERGDDKLRKVNKKDNCCNKTEEKHCCNTTGSDSTCCHTTREGNDAIINKNTAKKCGCK